MKRRRLIQSGLAVCLGSPLLAALRQERLDEAADVLARATADGQVSAAVLHVVQRETSFTQSFGKARNEDAMFLLGSISKPICVTALMTLFERGEFELADPLKKFIPQFTADARLRITGSAAEQR
jgi:CubicO group peptidase (beta-lactamase class C family)